MQTSDELQLAFSELCAGIPRTLSVDDASALIDELNILRALLVLHIHKAQHVE